MEKLALGTVVGISGTARRGKIVDGPNRRGEYLVQIGNMELWAHREKLAVGNAALDADAKRKSTGSTGVGSTGVRRRPTDGGTPVETRFAASSSGPSVLKLDLHGKTRADALEILERSIDRALLQGTDQIELVHGLGSGALRDAAHQYLGRCRHVKHFKLDELNPGVTRIYL